MSDDAVRLAADMLARTAEIFERAARDPFGKPVLSVALAITRDIDDGRLDADRLEALVRYLRDVAFADRARRLADYVGGVDPAANGAALDRVAAHVARPDPDDSPVPWARFRDSVERCRYAAVFTAHPTFGLRADVARHLAEAAGGGAAPPVASHRPEPPTLEEEFGRAVEAIANGRDALDRLNGKYGSDTVTLGLLPKVGLEYAGAKVAFTRIPEREEFSE